jgi:hypothetical protein
VTGAALLPGGIETATDTGEASAQAGVTVSVPVTLLAEEAVLLLLPAGVSRYAVTATVHGPAVASVRGAWGRQGVGYKRVQY